MDEKKDCLLYGPYIKTSASQQQPRNQGKAGWK